MFAFLSKNGTAVTKDVLYINASKDKISFGLILEVDGQLRFGESYFYDSAFYASLKNKESMTKKEFNEYLMQLNQRRLGTSMKYFNVEYTTLDEDYETAHKQEFETLTKNGFERLATVGVQGDSILNEGEIVKDYKGAKILLGFKTPMDDVGLSKDMGNVRSFSVYSLIKNGENMELIHLRLVGENTWAGWELSALESVLQNKDNAWRIFKLEKYVIAKENLVLFDAPIMTIGNIA